MCIILVKLLIVSLDKIVEPAANNLILRKGVKWYP